MKFLRFFDKLEDVVRKVLSHRPIPYALLGGIGVVLFWRGVWHTADVFPFLTGPVSFLVGAILLLITGLFVSVFIGDQVIISGLRGEKKVADKTEREVEVEETAITRIHQELHAMSRRLRAIERKLEEKK